MISVKKFSGLAISLLLSIMCVKTSLAQDNLVFRNRLQELEMAVGQQNELQGELNNQIKKLQGENQILCTTLEDKIRENEQLKAELSGLRERNALDIASYYDNTKDLRPPVMAGNKEKSLSKVIHVNLGYSYYMKRRIPEAIEEYQKALVCDPADKDAHFNLAYLLAKQERYTEAVEHYQKAIKGRPEDREIYYNLSVIYSTFLNDSTKADKYYQKYTELALQ